MKIVTVTLNPAIDQTVRVDNLQPSSVNRGQHMQFDAGGKGVNVASFLADAGFDVVVTGFLGADNPRLFEALFAAKGMEDRFIRIPGATRTNVKIVDEARQQTTDINMPGATPPELARHALARTVESLTAEADWFVLSGNLPPGVPADIYATLIGQIREHGRHVVLDTSRAALAAGVAAGPTLVKPNVHELAQLTGAPLTKRAAVVAAARDLLDHGITLVVISMGEAGALFVDGEQVLQAVPPRVPVKSTVGAGDAMVAGLVAGRQKGLDLAATARLATAYSLGAISRVGAHLPEASVLESYVSQVVVQAPDLAAAL